MCALALLTSEPVTCPTPITQTTAEFRIRLCPLGPLGAIEVASRPVGLERMKLPGLLLAATLLLLSACGSARVPPTPPKTVTPQCTTSCTRTPAPQATSLTPQQAASAAAAAGTPDVTGSCTLLYAGTGGQTFPNTPAGLQHEHA